MKLVIEKYPDGSIYAYRIREKDFRRLKDRFEGERLEPTALDGDCSLDDRGSFHMVFDLKK